MVRAGDSETSGEFRTLLSTEKEEGDQSGWIGRVGRIFRNIVEGTLLDTV